jgi:hypothetical protein
MVLTKHSNTFASTRNALTTPLSMGNGNKNTQMSVLLKEKTNLIWL